LEQSPSLEAASHSASQDCRFLWNSEVHDRIHNSPPLVPLLSQMNPVHTFLPNFSKIHSKIYKRHAMKAYWGSGGIAPLILILGTTCRCVVRFMSRPLYPQAWWATEAFWTRWCRGKCLFFCRESNPGRPTLHMKSHCIVLNYCTS